MKRGYVGLLGKDATRAVAKESGVSASTVSRRARRAVGVLRDEYLDVALSA